VVKLIKESKTRPITCAIGDGANDVSMIQEADVGLGIFGKEGRNAARSSDFAFSQFKYLKRALLVHGYLYYTRLCTLILYFFYKNIVLVNCQIFYAPISAFSVQSLYPLIYMVFYNVFFSAFPIATYGLLEQKIKIKQLEINPAFYKTISKNRGLSLIQFIKWNIAGLWHSIVAYYSTYLLFTSDFISIEPSGKICGEVEFGSIVFIQVLIMVHIKLFLVWKSINLLAIFSYLQSVLAFVIWCLIPNAFIMPFPFTTLTEEQSLYWALFSILSYPSVWLCFLVSSSIAMIPDIILHLFENVYQDYKLEMSEKKSNLVSKKCDDSLPRELSEQRKKRKKLQRKKSINWKITNDKVKSENNFFELDKISCENSPNNLSIKENQNSTIFGYREYRF
ncbi:putative phospholipid-transporting ATPase IF isoform X1, partial [Brachionus plicatilis]